ncbi:MAG: DUF92 domain-containing protein [Candidatus Micrarchaeota archaeon]
MFSHVNALIGLIVTLVIAIYAFKKSQLTAGGTIAALLLGFIVFTFGGWTWLALMAVFFISAGVLTRFKASQKKEAYEEFAKGGERDFWQVFANGALPALIALFHQLYPSPAVFAAFVAVVATATADTWATEIGILGGKPFMLTTFKRVRIGSSGAVSLRGLGAALIGALLIAVAAILLNSVNNLLSTGFAGEVLVQQFVGGEKFILFIAIGGLLGSLVDSMLGATVQGGYYCPDCKKETERVVHKCGCKTKQVRGWKAIDNDVVNFLSALAAGFAVWLVSIAWL